MSRSLFCAVLTGVLAVMLVGRADAESLDTAGKQLVAGIVVVSVGIGVGITLIVLHEKHKTAAMTGCVAPGPAGMALTDEKDKRTYSLSGDPVGLKSGDRMTLEGKRRGNGKMPIFEARAVVKDLGPCQR